MGASRLGGGMIVVIESGRGRRPHRRGLLAGLLVVMFFALGLTSPAARASAILPVTVIQVSGMSPFTFGCNGAPQTGYVYMNAEVEPWIAVDPTNPNHFVGVWQQDRWSNGGANGLLTGVSWDRGQTWFISWAPFTYCSGGSAANGGNWERASDPWVTFAPNGDVYQIAIAFDSSDARNAVVVSKSTDGGMTWGNPTTLILDRAPTFFNDKESITADPHDSNYVYAVWDRYFSSFGRNYHAAFDSPVMFSRTTDGGKTWEAPRAIFDPGLQGYTVSNQIVVLPDGGLVDMFTYFTYQFGDQVAVIRSSDRGLTWSAPTIIATEYDFGVWDPPTGQFVRSGAGVPEIAVDPRAGTDTLYVVWEDFLVAGDFWTHVALSASTDGGLTWSTPMKVDQAPFGVQAFTPSVEVAADGTVAVTYYDFREPRTDLGFLGTDYWVVGCDPSDDCTRSASWSETQIAGPFNMLAAPYAYGLFVGDYEGLAAVGNDFVALFSMATPSFLDAANVYVAFLQMS